MSNLEEIAIATLTYHILKGLKSLHSFDTFHGNIRLENIIFTTIKKENDLLLINFKYYSNKKDKSFREKLIKRGNN